MKKPPTVKERLIQALLKDRRYKFRELRQICKTDDVTLRRTIDECRREGFKINYGRLDRTFFLARTPTPYTDGFDMTWLPEKGKVGLVSDTHLCSDSERLDLIEKAYDRFAEEGIKTVIHAGDMMDGWEVYRGHSQHIKTAGASNQARYCIQNYPTRKGMKTYFIGGNHDNKSFEKQGADQCSLVVNGFEFQGKWYEGRKDLVYLGQYSRMLNLQNECTIQVLHPHGGSSYAISYPQQKRAREMKSDDKPSMQVTGHFHTFSYILQDYVHMIALPAFQDHSEFFVRLGYPRMMGFCIMEYQLGFIKFERVKLELVSLV